MQLILKNVLGIILGGIVGWILDAIVSIILVILLMNGYGLGGHTFLGLESRIVVFIVAVVILFIVKNRNVKWLAAGAIIYAVAAYLFFKFYFLPKSMDRITEMFLSQKVGSGEPSAQNLTQMMQELNKK